VIALRVLGTDDWATWRAMRRDALADSPDAFGSTLSAWSGPGDTEARWRARLVGVAHNVLAELDGVPVGMVSATAPADGDVELLSMWVTPQARGLGVGNRLVVHVIDWALEMGAVRVVLDVRATNPRAIALYERHGFKDLGPVPEPAGAPRSACPERRMSAALGRRPR
jgi:ribosomal protein S18 acetylase RimI-like enzyme